MFNILIADALPAEILNKYNDLPDIKIENKAGISREALIKELPQYQGLVVRSRTKVTLEILESGLNLKVIGRAGAGVDNIDTKEATRRGIIVMNTPGGNTIAATEHTIALMLSVLRNIPPACASMRKGKWDRKSYLGNELFEKTVGIVGLGKIGREVAKRIGAFGSKIVGYDPILTQKMADRLGIELLSFEELLKVSDIITLHVPKMANTLNMINQHSLNLCKKGVVIINCARGGIVNEKDLIDALNSGKVSLAGVDVFENEPPENWELALHHKVAATPHLGASTEEAQTKVAVQILDQMVEYFRKDVAYNAVNFVSLDEKIQSMIAPYFHLAQRLGTFFSQIRRGRLQEVAIRFYGEIMELPVESIASHLMAGALKANNRDKIAHDVDLLNMVNSMAIAREKGVSIEISKKDRHLTNQTNLIACDFHTEQGLIHLEGTVYAKDIYRLIKFGNFDVDTDLAGKMVMVENKDVPGIIGNVGTILAKDHINIGQVSSGRDLDSKSALNIFHVDGNLNSRLIQALQDIPNLNRMWLVDIG